MTFRFWLLIHAIVCISVGHVYTQAPQSVSYQAVATNDNGLELINHNLGIRATVVQGSATGPNIYQETFNVYTDDFGLFTVKIGNGVYSGGTVNDFAAINWGAGPFWLRIEMDETGGTNYEFMGANQILSVPYSIYSDYADTASFSFVSEVANYADTAFLCN